MTAKQKQRPRRPSLMSRELRVTSTLFYISAGAEKPRGLEPVLTSNAWLELMGEIEEPVRNVSKMSLTVHPQEKWERAPLGPPSIGGIIQFKPHLHGLIYVPFFEFQLSWSTATSGQLKFVHLAFTEPQSRHSFIVSTLFATKSEYDES